MPQLHCYVPEPIAHQLQRQATLLGLSVSAYLADLVKRDVSAGWPEDFEASLFGPAGDGSPLSLETVGPAPERIALR